MILLDTNVLLRLGNDGALSPTVVQHIDDLHKVGDTVAVSPIVFWEVAMLNLKMPGTVDADALRARSLARGIKEAPLTSDVAITAARLGERGLPVRDPADRFIVATAIRHGYDLATIDRAILGWDGPLRCLDARP